MGKRLPLKGENYIVGRCPACGTGPLVCRERQATRPQREHGPNGVCLHAECLGCGFEGSVQDYEPTADRDAFMRRFAPSEGGKEGA